MSERIAAAFAAAQGEGRAALMPYLMGGFPDAETSAAVADAYADAGADLVEPGRRLAAHAAAIEHAEAARLTAEEQVLHHRELRDEVELLVDDGGAGRLGVAGRADRDGLAVDVDAAGVGGVGAAQDLHQRGLARAVLAHQRVDLPAGDGEVDAFEHPHGAE